MSMQGSEGTSFGKVRVQRRFCSSRLEPDLWAAVFDELFLGPMPQAAQVAELGRRMEVMSDIPMSQVGRAPSQSGAFAI